MVAVLLEALALFHDLPVDGADALRSLAMTMRIAAMLVGVGWLRRQWERLPRRLQVVREQGVTSWQAALRNFIPVYGLYWIFVVNAALCDGVNATLAKRGRARTAPAWLGTICPIMFLVQRPAEVILAGPWRVGALALSGGLWIAYMIKVERAFMWAKQPKRTGVP